MKGRQQQGQAGGHVDQRAEPPHHEAAQDGQVCEKKNFVLRWYQLCGGHTIGRPGGQADQHEHEPHH